MTSQQSTFPNGTAIPQGTFGGACAAFFLRETHHSDDTAYRCHRAYVNLVAKYAAESGKSLGEAAREVSQFVRTQALG